MKTVLAENFTGSWLNPVMTAPHGDRKERVEFDLNNPLGGFNIESPRHQGLMLETTFFKTVDGRFLWKVEGSPRSSADKPSVSYELRDNCIVPSNAITEFSFA